MSIITRDMLPKRVAGNAMHVLLGLPVRHVVKQGNSSGPGVVEVRCQPVRGLTFRYVTWHLPCTAHALDAGYECHPIVPSIRLVRFERKKLQLEIT